MKPIRVLLGDDHTIVRAGVRALLDNLPHVEVVGEASNSLDTIEFIEKLHPDVVLLDLMMPGMSGFDVLKQAGEKFPEVRIIVLSAYEEVEYAFQALHLGAEGYLPKGAASAELPLAIEHVMTGKKYLSPTIQQKSSFESGRNVQSGEISVAELTPRQREVLTLIAEGRSTKEISQDLNISVKTVETHRAQLMERLNIHNIASLVRFAIRNGIVSIDQPAAVKKARRDT